MVKQFSKHHGARPRQLAVGDRVVILTRKDKREKGVITKVISKTNYSVRLDDGKIVDRHINHIWKRGSPSSTSPTSQDDWMLYQPQAPQSPQRGSPPAPDQQPESSSTAQSPAVQNPELPATQPTPVRPARDRRAPRKLILDPSAKSYTQQ